MLYRGAMEERQDRLIKKIYDAALDDKIWPELLEDISAEIGAVAGFYAGMDTRRKNGSYWYAHRHDPKVQSIYHEHFLAIDPTLAHVIQKPGIAFSCSDYINEEVVCSNPFYTDFLIPNGIRYVLSGVVSVSGSSVSFFGFQRTPLHPPFGEKEIKVLQRLIPHFKKADEVATKISEISESKRLAMAFLDRLDYGVVFVDQAGNIRLTNERAERWLQFGEAITAQFGRIQMKSSRDDRVLDQLIKAATMPDHTQGGAFITTEDAGDVKAKIVVLPIGRYEQKHLDDCEAKAVIVIADSEQQRIMAPQVLQNSYGLTVAETKVAIGLVSGNSQDELCEKLFVSLSTIKTHTQRIFQKTGVNRQADLVRLVYGLPALF